MRGADRPLPSPRLAHLRRLTDETGVVQHALGALPDRRTGYTTDDNARALTAVLRSARLAPADGLDLAERYLAFLAYAQEPDGGFHNAFSYARRPLRETRSEDCQGRALQALVEAVWFWREDPLGRAAGLLLERALAVARGLRRPRGLAQAALAWVRWLDCAAAAGEAAPGAAPGRRAVEELLSEAACRLVHCYRRWRLPGWRWFEDALTYENAVLPHAMIAAGRVLGRADWLDAGLDALAFLAELTFRDGTFAPVGNRGWHPRGGPRAEFDQQPIEAGAMVLACLEAHRAAGDGGWRERALAAAAWFLGDNAHGLALLDPCTGGCHDGLTPTGRNANQGAESLLAWLLARLALAEGPAPIGPGAGTAASDAVEVVEKPWGREVWYAVTDRYAGKVLEVRAGHALSLQYHRRKRETLYFRSGSGRLRLGDRVIPVEPGLAVTIEPGTVHRVEATTDLEILEVSTPELDDVVRLEDRYGRADGAA